MPQRVSDEVVGHACELGSEADGFHRDTALDLRDARAEAARWRACADGLAHAARQAGNGECWCDHGIGHPLVQSCSLACCGMKAALARYDATKKEDS